MVIAAPRKTYTDDELLGLPDNGRSYERVQGEIREVPAGVEHDAIALYVGALMTPFARGRGVLAGSQAGFRMANGNLRSPDVSFTRKERLPGGRPNKNFGDVAPDLCVEVISASESAAEMQTKVEEYFASGAKRVWHLLPEAQQVRVFTAPTVSVLLSADEQLEGGDLLPGFRVRVGDLFDLGLD